MSTAVDRAGTFRATITESGVSASQKGMPQFVADYKLTQFWCDDSDLFAHFGITEAGWVDWSSYDMSTIGYLQLVYADQKKDGQITPMFYVEQLVEALGWDGTSFSGLGETDWTGKEVTVWIDENEYNGKTSLRVQAIGAADASPSRGGVRALDASELKGLDAQFAAVLGGAAAKAAAAKAPAAKAPAKPPAKAPAAAPKPAAATAAPVAATPAPAAPAATAPSATPPVAAAAQTAASMTKDEAWAKVAAVAGKSDEEKANAWIEAADAAIPNGDEDSATGEHWAALAKQACAILDVPF